MSGKVMNGVICYIDKNKGFGYISSDDLENNIAVYNVKDFYKNQNVEFEIVTSKKTGKPYADNVHGKISFDEGQVKSCYEFAKKMIGNHNPAMISERTDQEMFRDDFRGKLGEVALKNVIDRFIPEANITRKINFDVDGRGGCDQFDLGVNNKIISVRSVRSYASYLMIEKYRFKSDGGYSHVNDDGTEINIDLFILMRITIKALDGSEPYGYKDGIDTKKDLDTLVSEEACRPSDTVYAEVLGGITLKDFWAEKHLAPKGIPCTGKVLREIFEGKSVNIVTNPESYNKAQILQKDYYILPENELRPIESLF